MASLDFLDLLSQTNTNEGASGSVPLQHGGQSVDDSGSARARSQSVMPIETPDVEVALYISMRYVDPSDKKMPQKTWSTFIKSCRVLQTPPTLHDIFQTLLPVRPQLNGYRITNMLRSILDSTNVTYWVASSGTPIPMSHEDYDSPLTGYQEYAPLKEAVHDNESTLNPVDPGSTDYRELCEKQRISRGTPIFVLYIFNNQTAASPGQSGLAATPPVHIDNFLSKLYPDASVQLQALDRSEIFGTAYKQTQQTLILARIAKGLGVVPGHKEGAQTSEGGSITWSDVVDWAPGVAPSSERNIRGQAVKVLQFRAWIQAHRRLWQQSQSGPDNSPQNDEELFAWVQFIGQPGGHGADEVLNGWGFHEQTAAGMKAAVLHKRINAYLKKNAIRLPSIKLTQLEL
ncbi:hypothetical protein SCP_1300230 [Sparassis crispa]|uniref:Uncharacterized protein n=1 Tax=Sparassis crispa TaxID=139825 RepID=A0A401H1E3_9APHY|nr:hypothetical protein SCP_1300230 [Sparassis crispa]GBE88209.1 hypothetical protein SCP_1300230 [Sparassis crispa]